MSSRLFIYRMGNFLNFKKMKFVLIISLLVSASAYCDNEHRNWIKSGQYKPLPLKLGVAGAFGGESTGALIVAGGANFPEPLFIDGQLNPLAKKTWYDDIYVLESPDSNWIAAGKLPRPIAYGASVTYSNSVICIGGNDANQCFNDVFKINWVNKKIIIEDLPSLPSACSNLAAAVIDKTLYVAAGQYTIDANFAGNQFWSLDLSNPNSTWQELEPFPGTGRILAVAAVQNDSFFIVSGCSLYPAEDGSIKRKYLTDGYCYTKGINGARGKWMKIADVPVPVSAAPSPAFTSGQSHFIIAGGDTGTYAEKTMELKDKHPGFSRDIYGYHLITNTWSKIGNLKLGQVTAPAVVWNNNYTIISGEIRPGTRTPAICNASVDTSRSSLKLLDYAMIIVYLASLIVIGYVCSKRGKGTKDYFLGGGRIPWWATGLSIFSTMLSSITFMAIPAKSFATDWVYLLQNIPILLLAPVIIYLYLPFFRRLNITTAYEYLEKRFNVAVRLIGSVIFVFFQIGRMAIVLFLPSIALAAVTPLNVYTCIITMGVLCTIYTYMGGIEAVIWTDTLQAVVLLVGAIIPVGLIMFSLDNGVASFFTTAAADNKFQMFNLSGDYTTAVVWVVFLGGIFGTLGPYTSDYTVVQRYMTTSSEKKAAKAIWTNAIVSMPASLLFFLVGTALYVFYKNNPNELVPGMKTDMIFPIYIVQQLPAGLSGIVLAGIFAAAQSTLASSMNSIATVLVTDFYKRFNPASSDAFCFKLGKGLTLFLGMLGTATAVLLASANIGSLWDIFLEILGLFGGGLAGLFVLGIFTTRTNGRGAIIGALCSATVLFYLQRFTNVHFFLYSGIGTATCVIVGYLSSFLFSKETKSLEGLTMYSMNQKNTID
ncbi:MAG: sodium/solute symporter [Phycisphaerales bacterium]